MSLKYCFKICIFRNFYVILQRQAKIQFKTYLMRKIYSLFLMMVMAAGISFHANADVTVKVNMTDVAYFDDGNGAETVFSQEVTMLPPNMTDMLIGTIKAPGNYVMSITNETRGTSLEVRENGGVNEAPVNPSNVSDGDVLNITLNDKGSVDPSDKIVTFVFVPEESGYVVTLETQEVDGQTVNVVKDTYLPDAYGEVVLAYDNYTQFEVRPNDGYALINMKDENNTNPHDNGVTPGDSGNITYSMAYLNPNAVLIVTAAKSGSFTLKGVGENLGNARMQNMSNYSYTQVTAEPQTITFAGGAQYKFESTAYNAPLWKVEVTRDGYTDLLTDSYGSFYYTPNDGDEVVVYTDKPETYANIKLTFEGEDVTDAIIKSVQYDYQTVEAETWKSDDWTVKAGSSLTLNFDIAGFAKILYSVNGGEQQSVTDSYGYCAAYIQIENDDPESVKEFNIAITAEKEKFYNVTILTDNPESFQIVPIIGYGEGTPFEFTQSGDQIAVSNTNNTIKFKPNFGWTVDGILVDGEAPAEGSYYDGRYVVSGDCTITVNVSDLNAKRDKTAAVYVQEDIEWVYLSFRFADYSEVPLQSGYNLVKFCDDDLPLSFGAYSPAGEYRFYVDDQLVTVAYNCPETLNLEDGAVIKYFAGAVDSFNVTCDVDAEIADDVEVYHDYVAKFDQDAFNDFNCYNGTVLQIKPAADAETLSLKVTVDGEEVDADEDGVVTLVVDSDKAITVSKGAGVGVDGVDAADDTFDVISIQGVMVKRAATSEDLKSLPAGIYVAGGRKVVIK